ILTRDEICPDRMICPMNNSAQNENKSSHITTSLLNNSTRHEFSSPDDLVESNSFGDLRRRKRDVTAV
ncbi:hypothetical protein PFISCL1PPCAC_9387, partial [Pristionchus fissidentatus]